MKINRPKCQIYFYNEPEPYNAFELKDLITTILEKSADKKNVEFMRISGLDENNKKFSIRWDFGSITTEQKGADTDTRNEISRTSRLFGEILVQTGCLNREQLDECLSMQSESKYNKKLGEILIEKGYLKPNDIIDILSQQVGESYLNGQLDFKKNK